MDIGIIINSAIAVICLATAFVLPWKMGWIGVLSSHFATLLGFLIMGAVNACIDPKYYDGILTVFGLVIFAFVFNIAVLPVSLTARYLHQRKRNRI